MRLILYLYERTLTQKKEKFHSSKIKFHPSPPTPSLFIFHLRLKFQSLSPPKIQLTIHKSDSESLRRTFCIPPYTLFSPPPNSPHPISLPLRFSASGSQSPRTRIYQTSTLQVCKIWTLTAGPTTTVLAPPSPANLIYAGQLT